MKVLFIANWLCELRLKPKLLSFSDNSTTRYGTNHYSLFSVGKGYLKLMTDKTEVKNMSTQYECFPILALLVKIILYHVFN